MARPSKSLPNIKIGMTSKFNRSKEDMIRNHFARKNILRIPNEIQNSNPDKHFAWVSMNKLQKNGMWHDQGYQLFRTDKDSLNLTADKFTAAMDPYLHRNEMVLAWIPQEEHEMRLEEAAAMKELRDYGQLVTGNMDAKFDAYATLTTQTETLEQGV